MRIYSFISALLAATATATDGVNDGNPGANPYPANPPDENPPENTPVVDNPPEPSSAGASERTATPLPEGFAPYVNENKEYVLNTNYGICEETDKCYCLIQDEPMKG